jgi:hypothetical protein
MEVVERQHADVRVICRGGARLAQVGGALLHVGSHVAVREHHSLGLARRADHTQGWGPIWCEGGVPSGVRVGSDRVRGWGPMGCPHARARAQDETSITVAWPRFEARQIRIPPRGDGWSHGGDALTNTAA